MVAQHAHRLRHRPKLRGAREGALERGSDEAVLVPEAGELHHRVGDAAQVLPGAAETHHELELGVIIGAPACCVAVESAMEHVAGYCLALDMTDRAGQDQAKKEGKPWTAAKGWDTSCPVSDMVPAARVPDPSKLSLWLRVNGEEKPRQSGPTSDMVFGVPELIAAVSRVHTLQVGDLLLTGTPEGVGPVFPGDVITAGITELGVEIQVPIEAGSTA
eukprot:CAMPEP_0179252358 /NCGR_PEP_ID=MMETSP0797-20121207/22175_1 /TAXON_ID=47934 /ORGANISM="Dinophysis acuminata, Strain DAEP01" /LENGTH=216 /DNA_ID=CAMNT_0020960189 /DNA_START=41 /DNA_END=695 /DNA_ORIENTATION=+